MRSSILKGAVGTVIAVIFIGVLKLLERPWPDVDIDLETCQPSGPISRIARAWDPLEFWVDQHLTLEIALEREDFDWYRDSCLNRRGEPEIRKCVAFYQTRHDKMLRCVEHAARLCRNEGGRC